MARSKDDEPFLVPIVPKGVNALDSGHLATRSSCKAHEELVPCTCADPSPQERVWSHCSAFEGTPFSTDERAIY